MGTFHHLTEKNTPHMVDVSEKKISVRTAKAIGELYLGSTIFHQLQESDTTSKGPVFQTAILAGIQGAKKTSDLIPLCHPLPLSKVEISIELVPPNKAIITASVKTTSQTGVEMEALTAVSIASLTMYDMCKAISKEMRIGLIYLDSKTGGKSGDFHNPFSLPQERNSSKNLDPKHS